MSCQTARATAENVVCGGTSRSGSPYASQAATSAPGTVSCTGATPKPRAAPPAATIRATYCVKWAPDPVSGMCAPAVSSSSPPSRYGYGSAISEVWAPCSTTPGPAGPASCRRARSSRPSRAARGTGGVGGTTGSGTMDVPSIQYGSDG